MIRRQLVRCTECNSIALLSSLDESPKYGYAEEKWRILEKDDRATFLQTHHGHRLEELHVIENSFISRQDCIEPVKAIYFEASNGTQRFLIKKSREKISIPFGYELIPGKLRFSLSGLRIEEAAIREELEKGLSPNILSAEKIDYFIRQLKTIVSQLDPETLTRVTFESPNPSVRYFYLNETTLEKALNHCAGPLDKTDVKRIGELIRRRLTDGLFFISGKVDFQIVKILKSGQPVGAPIADARGE